jgi:hypothetical protein
MHHNKGHQPCRQSLSFNDQAIQCIVAIMFAFLTSSKKIMRDDGTMWHGLDSAYDESVSDLPQLSNMHCFNKLLNVHIYDLYTNWYNWVVSSSTLFEDIQVGKFDISFWTMNQKNSHK